MNEKKLPQESDSQRIGRLAGRCFSANLPNTWAETSLEGKNDFGLDFQIQDMKDGVANHSFFVQLKGTESPTLSASGDFYSIELATTTLNYYQAVNGPVMLVIADLSVNPSIPKSCPCFYVWVDDELNRIKPDFSQAGVTLRVPVSNRLHEDLDLSADIVRRLSLAGIGGALDQTYEERLPGLSRDTRAMMIESIPRNISPLGTAFLEAVAETPNSAWIDPKPGTIPWHFKEAEHHLRRGDTESAQHELSHVEIRLSSATPLEQSDYWYLLGRTRQNQGEAAEARDCFARASAIPEGSPKRTLAWAESEMHLLFDEDSPSKPDLSHVLARLTGLDEATLGMKARVLAAEGKLDEALALAASFAGIESLMARAVIHCVGSDFQKTVQVCEQGLAYPTDAKTGRQLFLLLRARGRFRIAVAPSSDHEDRYPPGGPVTTDIEELSRAWNDIQEAVEELKRAGWPTNVDYLADIWSSAAIILGKQKETIAAFASAGRAQPKMKHLQRGLELVAIHCKDMELALEANSRLPMDDLAACHRTTMLHAHRRDQDCVNFFLNVLPRLNVDHPHFGEAITVAMLSAQRIVRNDLVEEWYQLLDSREALAPYRALFSFFSVVDEAPLGVEKATEVLVTQYRDLGEPIVIAQQLIALLDPADTAEATECLAIAKRLADHSMLNLRVTLIQAQSLATLRDWPTLLDACEKALRQFVGNERLVALKALALEKLGRASEALDELKALMRRGVLDVLAMKTYVAIVLRCGFEAEAIDVVTEMLSSANTKRERLKCLQLLFALAHASDPESARAYQYALAYGRQSDPEDEFEEGAYLTMVLQARLTAAIKLDSKEESDLNARMEQFFLAFPASKILRRGKISEDASPLEIIEELQRATGWKLDENTQKAQLKALRQLQRGELPFPFSWRPKHLLHHVGDVVTLWQFSKGSPYRDKQYHLTMAGSDWTCIAFPEHVGQPPLFDLISLTVLHDLQLLDELFHVFPKIAVGQATLEELTRLSTPPFGGAMQQKCSSIRSFLRENFDRVLQPYADVEENNMRYDRFSDEAKSIVAKGNYIVYSDDMLIRGYLTEGLPEAKSLCTLDLIEALSNAKHISAVQAAEKIALLCEWRVTLPVQSKHIAELLFKTIPAVRDVNAGMAAIRRHPSLMSIFNNIWHGELSAPESVTRAVKLVAYLLSEADISVPLASSAIALWCGKAKLQYADIVPLDNEAILIIHAAAVLPNVDQVMAINLIAMYRQLVEAEHGDRMDEHKEREGLMNLGRLCEHADSMRRDTDGDTLHARLSKGFIDGTSDCEAFHQGYAESSSSRR